MAELKWRGKPRPTNRMNTEIKIKELEKAKQRSKKTIPVMSVSLIGLALFFWIIARFVFVPIWIIVIVLGLTALILLGDIINYIYCGLKLKTLLSKQ